MMKLSKKIDYALILLRDLCTGSRSISARDIAARYHLPPSMVANILKTLSGRGILASTRGAQGGYELARSPGRISLAEVVEALEGPFILVDCVEDDACCQFSASCPTHDPMQAVHRRFREFMDGLSLAEILGLNEQPLSLRVKSDENAYLPG